MPQLTEQVIVRRFPVIMRRFPKLLPVNNR
jgi:hypothetical protein